MKELLDKLSSYNILNFLFPGVLFSIIAEKITSYKFIQGDIVIGLFFYYFVGLVISRVGSLVIEPVLKRFSFVKFADYKEFVAASKKDEKLSLLSEINNMYRTVISVLFLSLLLKLYEFIEAKYVLLKEYSIYILIIILLFLFLQTYKKQTHYIYERVFSRRVK